MNIDGKKTIETRMSIISWEDEENGIAISVLKPKTEVTIDNVKEDYEIYRNNFLHPKRKVIVDISDVTSIGKEARDFIAGPDGAYSYFEAVAFLSNSKFGIGSIIVHVAMKVYMLRKPTKLFYNKKDAIDWLKSIK